MTKFGYVALWHGGINYAHPENGFQVASYLEWFDTKEHIKAEFRSRYHYATGLFRYIKDYPENTYLGTPNVSLAESWFAFRKVDLELWNEFYESLSIKSELFELFPRMFVFGPKGGIYEQGTI